MIEYRTGSLLTEDAEALVNTVNCVGVMGRGIALQFKHAFPANFKAYEAACKRGEVVPGRMFVFSTGSMLNPRYIVNFPTKRHWKEKSRLEDIEAGLAALTRELRDSVAWTGRMYDLGSRRPCPDSLSSVPSSTSSRAILQPRRLHEFPCRLEATDA